MSYSQIVQQCDWSESFFNGLLEKPNQYRHIELPVTNALSVSYEIHHLGAFGNLGCDQLRGRFKVTSIDGSGDAVLIRNLLFDELCGQLMVNTPFVVTVNHVEKTTEALEFELLLWPAKISRAKLLARIERRGSELADYFKNADKMWMAGVEKELKVRLKQAVFSELLLHPYECSFAQAAPGNIPSQLVPSEKYNWMGGLIVTLTGLEPNGDFTLLCEVIKKHNFNTPSNFYWEQARENAIVEIREIIHDLVKDMTAEEEGWTTLLCLDVDHKSRHYNPDRVGIEVFVR